MNVSYRTPATDRLQAIFMEAGALLGSYALGYAHGKTYDMGLRPDGLPLIESASETALYLLERGYADETLLAATVLSYAVRPGNLAEVERFFTPTVRTLLRKLTRQFKDAFDYERLRNNRDAFIIGVARQVQALKEAAFQPAQERIRLANDIRDQLLPVILRAMEDTQYYGDLGFLGEAYADMEATIDTYLQVGDRIE